MSAARAVLWDMDGTLIDSEEFHWISWRNTMANEGIIITREQFLSSFGQRNDSILPQWLGAASTPERQRGTLPSSGAQGRHVTAGRGCKLVAPASRSGMATSNCFRGTACEHRCGP